jgi:hypothetical protein
MTDQRSDRALMIRRTSGPIPTGPATAPARSFEAFCDAKVELRAAETMCRTTWFDTRSGDAGAWRRYRAALRRRERAIDALRHLELVPAKAR